MKIEIAEPPMINEIKAAFPNRPPGVIYAFGDRIYNPGGFPIPPALIAHEAKHGERQLTGGGVEVWWRRYIEDVQFRFDEEVHAHAAETLAQMPRDRNQRAFLMMSTVNRLLAPFYGYGDTVTRADAVSALKKAIGDVFTRSY